MLPKPATSTTFSCHDSKTLIAAPEFSFPDGLPPICENPAPVLCGVRVEPLPDDLDETFAEAAMPLYLFNPQQNFG